MATTLDRLLYNMAANAIGSYLTEERIRKRMELQLAENTLIDIMRAAQKDPIMATELLERWSKEYKEYVNRPGIKPLYGFVSEYVGVQSQQADVVDSLADIKLRTVGRILEDISRDKNIVGEHGDIIEMYHNLRNEITRLPAYSKLDSANQLLRDVANFVSNIYADNARKLQEINNELRKDLDEHWERLLDLFGNDNWVSRKLWVAFGLDPSSFGIDAAKQLSFATRRMADLINAIAEVDRGAFEENDRLRGIAKIVLPAAENEDIDLLRSAVNYSGDLAMYLGGLDEEKFRNVLEKMGIDAKGIDKGSLNAIQSSFSLLAKNIPLIANEFREYAIKAGGNALEQLKDMVANSLQAYYTSLSPDASFYGKLAPTNRTHEGLGAFYNEIPTIIKNRDVSRMFTALDVLRSFYTRLRGDVWEGTQPPADEHVGTSEYDSLRATYSVPAEGTRVFLNEEDTLNNTLEWGW